MGKDNEGQDKIEAVNWASMFKSNRSFSLEGKLNFTAPVVQNGKEPKEWRVKPVSSLVNEIVPEAQLTLPVGKEDSAQQSKATLVETEILYSTLRLWLSAYSVSGLLSDSSSAADCNRVWVRQASIRAKSVNGATLRILSDVIIGN
ncbi:hypothetical protein ACFE04_007949 [Oxalis oulophora]